MANLRISHMQIDQMDAVLIMWKKLLDLTARVNDRYRLATNAIDRQREFFAEHYNNENTFCFIADQDGKEIGFANGYVILPSKIFMQSQIGLIENIFIEEEFRKKGYGKRLVQACYDWFYQVDINEVFVNVVPANEGSKAFWESIGYKMHKITLSKSI